MAKHHVRYADDDTLSVAKLFRMRLPALLIGLVLGIGLTVVLSRFEEVLAKNVEIVFFIPFVVYMASAVGGQTQSIYVRDLRTGRANFKHYLVKESFLGLIFGLAAALGAYVITTIWFANSDISLAAAGGMFGAVLIAPLVALLVTEVLELEHTDPAVGAGPIATVIQDALSITIFGLVATAVLL